MESLPTRVSSSGGGARERAGDKGRSHLSEGHLQGSPHLGCDTYPAKRARGKVGDPTAFSWAEIVQFADEFVVSARPFIKTIGGCFLPEGYSL